MSADVMQMPETLADFGVEDIKGWGRGNRLPCNAPVGTPTADLLDQLRDREGETMSFQICPRWPEQPDIIPLQSRGTRTPIYAQPEHVGAPIIFSDPSKTPGRRSTVLRTPATWFRCADRADGSHRRYCRVLRIFPRERIS